MSYKKSVLSRTTLMVLLVMGSLGANYEIARAVDDGTAFYDEFNSIDSSRWGMADGWVCGSPFDTDWSADQVSVANSKATITLDNIQCGTMTEPYCSGELRTNAYQGYGCYEVRFKPSNVSGVVSSFYTFAGPYDTPSWRTSPSQHNEIDIEFLGKDTTTVQFNFWTNDDDYSSHNEHVHTLGFDASQGFHDYAIKWTSTGIEWYVDGSPVYNVADSTANPTPKTTDTTQKLMMNAWPVDNTASGWAGTFTYPGSPITVDYEWVKFTPGESCTIGSGAPAQPTVSFSTVSQSVTESGSKTITVQLSAASTSSVTVPYTVSGTATGGGVDHNLSNDSLVIPAGNTSGTITFTVTGDTLDEDNETVVVTMGTPVNATQGATTVHTATITDNDATPTVAFTASSQTVAESGSAVSVTARLSAVSGRNVTVPFTTSGTATKGTDYTISASPITIPAGQQTASATLTPIRDAVAEGNETATLTMGTPTNASRGNTRTHTVTITNN